MKATYRLPLPGARASVAVGFGKSVNGVVDKLEIDRKGVWITVTFTYGRWRKRRVRRAQLIGWVETDGCIEITRARKRVEG